MEDPIVKKLNDYYDRKNNEKPDNPVLVGFLWIMIFVMVVGAYIFMKVM